IRSEMRGSYSRLSEIDTPTSQQNWYSMPTMLQHAVDTLSVFIRFGNRRQDFSKFGSPNHWSLIDQKKHHLIQSESEEDVNPDSLTQIFDNLFGDETLLEPFREMEKIQIAVFRELTQFYQKLYVLVQNFDLGTIIDGKCDVGY